MPKFRKRPVVVEAEQYLGPQQRPVVRGVCLGGKECVHGWRRSMVRPHVTTAQGQHVAVNPGDWIIKEPEGQSGYYPCKPDVFAATYEPVGEERSRNPWLPEPGCVGMGTMPEDDD